MKCSLALDFGNSRVKIGLFENSILKETNAFDYNHLSEALAYIRNLSYDQSIYCSVGKEGESVLHEVRKNVECLRFDSLTKIPITIEYETPETLGGDRLAAAIGAWSLFPDSNCLLINMGTCITFDVLHKDRGFIGGNIAPGWHMRAKAMQQFTAKLPLANLPPKNNLELGTNTQTALQLGCTHGILREIKGYINDFNPKYTDLRCVISGGDTEYFVNQLKMNIFAEPFLVLKGLNIILENS